MKSTSAVAVMISMWVFSGWGVAHAAEPSLGSSFKEWCQQKASLSAEARKTVEALLEAAGTSDCEQAAENLLSRTELSLSGYQITDVSPLAGLPNLEVLYLRDNQITDVSPLAELMNLEDLGIPANPITDISPLAELTNLESLILIANPISDFSPLLKFTNLEFLYVGNNQITDVSLLTELQNRMFVTYIQGDPVAEPTCKIN
ncbi:MULTISPECIES: leucine-rich repeat domain-containing protein [unclassified Coleofasciculus]|uniref:leucine-rich repeat domain-containing protein n=1 Tax=unclassified Coleofasciculus TaxID=2692782 RepID=UPI0018825410|nr:MULTISPECIES: leucine-rich repeat domain-containing protein [unclassified Coleofasciculus]MBE9128052.1 leucine-rich repeat domain-containing protein [Coleofasciculus sp. LEGE 07081]MBE9149345.1 leucine-rich repeat domain-containing protein [Coleofasciculus sp. LEGE 07092]